MTEPTVELIFGMNAGIVWKALNQNGPSTIDSIVKTTGLRRELAYGALGWLGRENKIIVERRGRAMVFSLREAEAHLEAFKGTTIGDSVPQEQTNYHTSVLPEKTTEARKVKASASTLEVVKRALVFILSEFEANREPTPEQVSKALGMDCRQLGRALSKLDIKSKSIHRGGKSVKIYPFASKERVWELAALDTEGLQKMSEVRGRAMENDKEHNREHFTVFD
jgi:hypothetical protein